jgi:hypothetical protein
MKTFPQRGWLWLALMGLAGASRDALAQGRLFRVEEPDLFKMNITEVSAGAYAEGDYEETTFKNSGTSATHDRLFVGPSFGLNLAGSAYHPNLFQYQINTEGAYGWSQDELKSGPTVIHRNELEYLGRFSSSADILANKPFHTTVFGDYDHTYRDYDFFSRVLVDTWRYGLRSAYTAGSFTFTTSYTHRDEDTSSFNGPSIWQQDVVGFTAHQDRSHGGTTLTYTFDEYNRSDFDTFTKGIDHTVALSDTETFGKRDQMRLTSTASYTIRDADIQPSDEATAGVNLTIDHTDNLSSLYDLSFDRYSADTFSSDNVFGQAALRHKLYDSLISTVSLRGVDYESSDQLSSGFTRRYGIGLAESYSKRLGDHHQLRVDGSILGEHVDQQDISTVQNERHTFGEPGAPADSFFLNLLDVDPFSVQVWNVSRTVLYVQGQQYTIFQNGSVLQIQRITGAIPAIDPNVVVDYQAKPTPEGNYESLTDTFGVRFELWNNFWGLYGRYSGSQNNAPRLLSVQNLAIYTVGTDLNWRWFRAGAEYSIYHSDQSSYNSARLFESASRNLDDSSSISLELSQTWTDYKDSNRQETDYRFISHYRLRLTNHLLIGVEGGFDVRQGEGVDQTLATFRPGIDYVIGRTTIKAGYDFEYDVFLNNETRTKHMFSIRAKRFF